MRTDGAPDAEEDRLRALHDMGVLDTPAEERFDRITRIARDLFGVSSATVSLLDRDRQWFKSRQGFPAPEVPRRDVFCNVTIRRPDLLVVEDLAADERFADNPYVVDDPRVRFYAGHPLEAPGGQRVGTLCLFDSAPRRFGAAEQRALRELAGWTQAELVRSEELDRAAAVQRGLLPRRVPDVPGYDVAGLCLPSRGVGGDLMDWYRSVDGDLVLTLGDVMGKGTGAAIMMATVRAVMRTAGRSRPPADAVCEAAATLEEDLAETGTLVTLCHGVLRPATGVLRFVDAGHGLMVLVRADGSTVRATGRGLPLGVLPDDTWTEEVVVLEPGDVVVAFSDGVLDLVGGTLAGLAEIEDVARRAPDAAGVVERVRGLAAGTELPDDVTVAAVRRVA